MRFLIGLICLVADVSATATACTESDVTNLGGASGYRTALLNSLATDPTHWETALGTAITNYASVSADCKSCASGYYSQAGAACFLQTLLDPSGTEASTCRDDNLLGWRENCDSTYVYPTEDPHSGAGAFFTTGSIAVVLSAVAALYV